MATSAELLTEVDTAISALLSKQVQSYKVGEKEYTFVDLGELRRWRRELQREVAQQKTRRRGLLSKVHFGSS